MKFALKVSFNLKREKKKEPPIKSRFNHFISYLRFVIYFLLVLRNISLMNNENKEEEFLYNSILFRKFKLLICNNLGLKIS